MARRGIPSYIITIKGIVRGTTANPIRITLRGPNQVTFGMCIQHTRVNKKLTQCAVQYGHLNKSPKKGNRSLQNFRTLENRADLDIVNEAVAVARTSSAKVIMTCARPVFYHKRNKSPHMTMRIQYKHPPLSALA